MTAQEAIDFFERKAMLLERAVAYRTTDNPEAARREAEMSRMAAAALREKGMHIVISPMPEGETEVWYRNLDGLLIKNHV